MDKNGVHAPDKASAQSCRDLLPNNFEIIEDEEMNLIDLKTPIGTDSCMESHLEKKIIRHRREIRSLSKKSHLHECFTLPRSCALACKVTHLMRTTPPFATEDVSLCF